ncbi:unnamed protein product [Closterium sp. NIES-54]
MYALSFIAATALDASASGTPPGTAHAEALHTFTLESGASRCFFRDSTTLTPHPAPVPVRLADPSGGPVVASSSTVHPCPAVPSGSLSGLHLPSFSTNLVSTAALQDAMVTTTTPGVQHVSICTCTRTGRHLATFTRRPGSSMYTLANEAPQVAASAQTLLWHHRLGHPSLPRLRGMHSRLLVSGLPRSLPPLPPSPALPCLPCVKGRQHAAPHSSSFPTTAPLQTLHVDVWGPTRVSGQGRERYFLLEVDDYTRYTTVFPLRCKGEVSAVLIPWIRTVRIQLRERFGQDLPVLRLHSNRGGEFSSDLLRDEPGWQFYHPTSCHVLPSQNVTFDELVPFFRLFPYRSAPSPAPPLFLAPSPPPVDPLLPQGPAPSGVSQVDPLPAGGAGSEGAGSGGAEPEGVELGGAESEGAEPGGAESEGAESGGAEPRGAALFGAGEPGGAGAGGAAVNTGARDPKEPGVAGAGGAGAGVAGVGGPSVGGAGATGVGAVDPGIGGAGGTVRPRLYFVPLLQQVLGVPSSTGLPPPFLCPPPDQTQPPLQPASPLPVPSPYTERRAASPTFARLLATAVTDPSFESAPSSALVAELLDFAAACHLDYAFALVAESVSASPPSIGGECALGTDVLEDRQKDFECLAAAVPRFASLLLAPEGDPDAPDIPTPRSYADAITGPHSSQWQAAMDAEMASWKSTGTYVDKDPPPGVNIVDGMWIFRVKRPPGSPPAFKARYVARGFSQRQGFDYFQTFSPTPKMTTFQVLLHVAARCDYKLHSQDFSTAFLQGSLHEEIRLRRPPGFTGSFPTGTQWSLHRPVYNLRQALREWHNNLRTTLAAIGHSLSAPPSDESVEPSGPYPELVGCLITSGMGLVLGGRGPVVLTGHADASWADDSATQRSSQGYTFSLGSSSFSWRFTCSSSVLSSSCEAEIFAGAMAAQVLRWLTYLLTDLGEQPRSPLVLYVDNKAMIALCQEHRLEHRTKHIALRYFLARELQQRGQLRLAYVATRANTADVFTKALPPGDH